MLGLIDGLHRSLTAGLDADEGEKAWRSFRNIALFLVVSLGLVSVGVLMKAHSGTSTGSGSATESIGQAPTAVSTSASAAAAAELAAASAAAAAVAANKAATDTFVAAFSSLGHTVVPMIANAHNEVADGINRGDLNETHQGYADLADTYSYHDTKLAKIDVPAKAAGSVEKLRKQNAGLVKLPTDMSIADIGFIGDHTTLLREAELSWQNMFLQVLRDLGG